MPVVSSSRIHALIGGIAECGAAGLLVAGLLGAGLVGSTIAQTPGARATKPVVNAAVGQPVVPLTTPTFSTIYNAARMQDCTLVQLRRFRDNKANVVAVRERLEIDADGSNDPRFALTFVGVEGELSGSSVWLKWQQTYGRYAHQLFSHASFQIRDLARAQQNYTLHDFGPTVRAARPARRVVVFPQSLDKAIWVIDLDSVTGVPLYTAEFDAQMHLLAEVEALTFVPSVQPLPSPVVGPGSVTHTTFAAAVTTLASPPGLVDPDVQVAAEYHLERIETRIDPLNAQPKLVMTYSDGIDQFMVVQSPGMADFFAGLPGSSATTTNTIGRYRDPAMSVLLFWEGGVSFQVAGRGALHRLDDLAKRVLLQALSSN